MRYTFLLASVATMFATPAFAQSAASEFSGPRIEARVGVDVVELDLDARDGADAFESEESESGLAYGLEAGYDVAVSDRVIVGGYAGIDFSDIEYVATVGNETAGVEAGRNITLGARLGYAVSGAGLLYVKGGYTNAGVSAFYDGPGTINDFADDDTADGFHLGAGGELRINRNVYLKAEYVYTNLGRFDSEDDGVEFNSQLDRHQVLAGIGFRF